MTMESVAARAGVGKPTVYRWWPDRHAVAMAALMDGSSAGEPAKKSSKAHPVSAVDLLRRQLRTIADRFAAPSGRHITSMIAAADSESELSKAFRNHFVLARRAEGRALLEQAAADKDVRGGLPIEVALDLLYGPLFFRLLMGHDKLDHAFTDAVLDQALRGLGTRRR